MSFPIEERQCIVCHDWFSPKYTWAKKCFQCWKEAKDRESNPEQVRTRTEYVRDPRLPPFEMWATMLMRMIKLAHPDRHQNSTEANAVTQWLLEERRRTRTQEIIP